MPEEDYDFTPASRLMQVNEVVTIAKAFVDAGVKKIRLTGGENQREFGYAQPGYVFVFDQARFV